MVCPSALAGPVCKTIHPKPCRNGAIHPIFGDITGIAAPGFIVKDARLPHKKYVAKDSMVYNFA
ncbi:MAG: hypothetical protein V2B19_22150 [Pseudomonadota bacterium]